ncbi:MAG: DNA polymerase/3'-5' exonuclease PolX [Candidatus Margulisiibacteriota bacterium]|nr:DNA polymerase/3'-5' exonuclease PolX [Candidatus Margulisiibacteriota bacterium]
MENSEIARIFLEISELLELKGENTFKIRAYQKAARSIEGLSLDLDQVYKEGGIKALKEIPGIGESLAEKIEEKITTGKVKKHQQLIRRFSPGFIELMDIPGLGPKTAMKLFKEEKINSIAKLKKAIKSGKIKDLPGIKDKKVQNISAGIKLKEKAKGRFLISEATEYAAAIVKKLEKMGPVKKIVPAGSLRRQKETIGDLDILVTSEKAEKITAGFADLALVSRVLAKGPTRSSAILKNNMQCDLRVVKPSEYGAALHYFTGSQQHAIAIRQLARTMGLKVSEYGVFKGKKRIAGRTEEEVFGALGLKYIPPELRENRGELEAAQNGKLPILVELEDIRGDLHCHSDRSDGSNTIAEMAAAGREMGYEYMAITDHSVSTRIAGGQTEKEFLKEMSAIEKLRTKGIKILKGVEVDILPDGSLDFRDFVLKEADVVIAAIHSRFKMSKKDMTKRILSAMDNKYVNIIAHPTGRLINERAPYEIDMEEIFRVAAQTGTFMELNSHPSRLDLNDTHCRQAARHKILVSINTDSHNIGGLANIRFGVSTARRGWLEKKDVLNSLPYAGLLKKLYQKRR